jgi:hypothetical protein
MLAFCWESLNWGLLHLHKLCMENVESGFCKWHFWKWQSQGFASFGICFSTLTQLSIILQFVQWSSCLVYFQLRRKGLSLCGDTRKRFSVFKGYAKKCHSFGCLSDMPNWISSPLGSDQQNEPLAMNPWNWQRANLTMLEGEWNGNINRYRGQYQRQACEILYWMNLLNPNAILSRWSMAWFSKSFKVSLLLVISSESYIPRWSQ